MARLGSQLKATMQTVGRASILGYLIAGIALPRVVYAEPAAGDAPASGTPAATAEGGGTEELDMVPSALFDRARSYYRSGLFEDCVESYEQLFSHGDAFPEEVSQETIEQGRLYFSSCLIALGRQEAAEEQMRAAMRANPLMEAPDPIVFPRQVQDLFFKVKADFLDAVMKAQEEERRKAEAIAEARAARQRREQERVRTLERLAAEETLVSKNERWMAAIPFGVGQFQNGDDTLGAAFLAGEALLLATTVTAVAIQLDTHSQADGGNVRDADPFTDQIHAAHAVELAAGAGFLLLAGVGILEAQLNFVPEHRIGSRPRRIPRSEQSLPSVDVNPTINAGPSGAVVGLSGRF